MRIDVWSDFVCPWCYIGKRRLEKALEGFEEPVELVWHSFELDPDAPPRREGSLDEHLARKYRVPLSHAVAMRERVTDAAAEDGLAFRFDIAKTGNTFDAHRLLHLAARAGKADEAKERLLRAYFLEGEAIGEVETLVAIGRELALGDEALEGLRGSACAEEVRADEGQARAMGIHGVPFFVFDGQLGVSGAQSPDVLRHCLDRALAMRTSAGDACGDDGCGLPESPRGRT